MIIGNELVRVLKNMKQEILNLKQIKKANCVSKYYKYTADSGGNYYYTWLITYKSGSQPIITEVYSYANTALSAPSNNQQYLFTFTQVVTSLTIFSTREIQSITGIANRSIPVEPEDDLKKSTDDEEIAK